MLRSVPACVVVATLSMGLIGLPGCDAFKRRTSASSMAAAREQLSLTPPDSTKALESIGALARRVPIRAIPAPSVDPIGVLTAGSTVGRSKEAVGQNGCPGGWYAVLPRGYVCLDEQTTLDLEHPTLKARGLAANPAADLPYPYAIARRTLRLFEPDPEHHDGVRERGQLSKGSTFAVVGSWDTLDDYDQRQRLALLTLGIFAPTRDIESIKVDACRGLDLDASVQRLPLGLPRAENVAVYRLEGKAPTLTGKLSSDDPIALTVKSRTVDGERFLMLTNDTYVAEKDVAVLGKRQEFPEFAAEATHWVDVDLQQGLMTTYEGTKPKYAMRIGAQLLDDRFRGVARVRTKQVTDLAATVSADSARRDYDTPWVIELDTRLTLSSAVGEKARESTAPRKRLALCPQDAARLFRFVQPPLPDGWHAVIAAEPSREGSPFVIH